MTRARLLNLLSAIILGAGVFGSSLAVEPKGLEQVVSEQVTTRSSFVRGVLEASSCSDAQMVIRLGAEGLNDYRECARRIKAGDGVVFKIREEISNLPKMIDGARAWEIYIQLGSDLTDKEIKIPSPGVAVFYDDCFGIGTGIMGCTVGNEATGTIRVIRFGSAIELTLDLEIKGRHWLPERFRTAKEEVSVVRLCKKGYFR